MTPDQERSDSTRDVIMRAAQNLFLQQGFHGTSMRQIAQSAGVVPGAIYNHFGSKEDLYLALLRDANIYNALAEALRDAQGDSTEGLLRDGAERLIAALRTRSDIMPLLFVDVLEFDARNVAVLAGEAVPSLVAFFGRVSILGAERGDLKPIRPDVLARAFLGLFASYFITTRFFSHVIGQFPGLDVNADLVDDFMAIFAHGALQPSAE